MSDLRREPALAILRNALSRVPFQPLDINYLSCLEFAGIPARNADHERARGDIRPATPQDAEELARCQHTPQAFLDRFAAGDHCVVAVADGRIVGYEWCCARSSCIEERYSYKIDVSPETVYLYDAFILPEYRHRGFWLKFQSLYLPDLMKKLSKRRILTMVDGGNRLSMNVFLRFGFRVCGKVLIVKTCGRSFSHAVPLQ
jgi:hypothetical protein